MLLSQRRRLLSTAQGAILGRPFLISKDEAMRCFEDWEVKFLPPILRTISRRNLQIQPILIPFYGDPKSNFVRYGGSAEYPFSDQLVSAAKTDASTWTLFDKQVLKTPDLAVISRWSPEPASPSSSSLQQAFLPAYMIRFLQTKNAVSTCFVGGETGKVSGLREHTVSTAKQEFQNAIRIQSNLIFLLPPVALAMLAWALVRIKYSHRIAIRLSRSGNPTLESRVRNEFCYLNERLSEEEREANRTEREEQAYQRYQDRTRRQERLEEIMSGSGSSAAGVEKALKMLQLPATATQEEIRTAYRAQLLKYHPDHFQGAPDIATQRTQEIIKAYRLLLSTTPCNN